jgi:type I restriction enzyme M protein
MRVKSGRLEPTVFPFFRHLMQHVEGLGFIFVGTHRMEALSSDYWSIFFNIALYKQVAFLGDQAARELIVKPVAGAGHGLGYDDLAVDKMLRVTASHPYFLQLICHALVNYANRERRGYLTIRDVNDVLEEMLELGEAHFAFLWDQSSPAERLALAALTRLLGYEPSVTASQVAELLAERGAAIEEQQVTQALRRLVERDIVREVRGQPPRYEYKIELVRLWVERHKMLGRVVEEVG